MQRGIFHVIALLCNALVEKNTHFTSPHCGHPTQICSSVFCILRKVYILYKSVLCITVQEFILYTLACSSVPRLILYALNPFSRGRECQQFVPYIYEIYTYILGLHTILGKNILGQKFLLLVIRGGNRLHSQLLSECSRLPPLLVMVFPGLWL